MSDTNTFTIGTDTVLSIVSNGAIITATILVSFEARQIVADLESKGLDGWDRFRSVEGGWDISLEYDRQDSTLDDFFALKEFNYHLGLPPPIVTISETTRNIDGSFSKYRYDGVALKYDTIGARKGGAKVEPKVSGKASTRVKVQ